AVGAFLTVYVASRMCLEHITERTVILSPDIARVVARVPVFLGDALPEGRNADPVPVETDVDAVMVAGRGVADDRQVAVVGKGLGTLVDPAVFVQVGELDLSRTRHFVGGLQERLRGVRVDVVLV